MGKILEYGSLARSQILAGVEKLAKTVRVTMGPRGRNVIIQKKIGAPVATKDGVSVAREIVLDHPIEELGCQLVKEAAGRTAAVAGDGTTTATVLTYSILKEGQELIDSGYNPINFRKGMDWALSSLLSEIDNRSRPLDSDSDLLSVATISVNGDAELGKAVADAFIAVNRLGMVTAEAKPGVRSSCRLVDGVELNSGFISQHFLDKGDGSRNLENPLILILDWEVMTHAEDGFGDAMMKIANLKRDVLILCRDLQKEAFSFFAQNFLAGRLRVCPVKIPKFGKHNSKWLEDLAALTSATIIGGEKGVLIKDFDISHLGEAKKAIVDSYKTKIIEPKINRGLVNERISLYNESLSHLIGDSDRADIQGRLGFLSGKSAIVTVGYETDLELREKGDRLEDALFAVQAAIKSGYVEGGGFTLWRAAQASQAKMQEQLPLEQHQAAMVLLRAAMGPARQIITNALLDPDEILNKINFEGDIGYNTATDSYENMIESGVIDPTLVTQTALKNAASIAQLLLTTDAVVVDNPNAESAWQPIAGYRLPSDNGLEHKH